MGTGYATKLVAVHDIKTELLKLNTKKITMTLDCCREGGEGGQGHRGSGNGPGQRARNPIIKLKKKKAFKVAEQEKVFTFKGTLEGLPSTDGMSFTQMLVAVCQEHGEGLPILEIEK